jgi:hypothetical protein
MPNDYSLARAKRPGNKSRIVIETPGVKDETSKPKLTATTPEDVKRAEIINRGGLYSDRIKIEPKFNAPPRKEPLPSDTDIKKNIEGQKTTT